MLQSTETQIRNNAWLAQRLQNLWTNNFPDVPVANTVYVKFGRAAATRLGSIKYGPSPRIGAEASRSQQHGPSTYITITGYFKDPQIPEFVVDAVLAHELSHYAHGFFSPHPQLYHHPHQQGIVDKELTKRGLAAIMRLQKRWLKTNWRKYLQNTTHS